jgi:hypothetical protein
MNGYCLVTAKQSIADVLAQAPTGKTAMFRVVSIPSTVPDHVLGEHVYLKGDKVYDFMCNERVDDLKAEDLMFVSYV